MYADIYGTDENKPMSMWCKAFMTWVSFALLVIVIFIIYFWTVGGKLEGFQNFSYQNYFDQTAAVPAYTEESLRQRVDDAVAAGTTSQLTGTRDIPVFFQDYDVEMKRSGTAVSSAREGFEGGKGDDELSKAMSGH